MFAAKDLAVVMKASRDFVYTASHICHLLPAGLQDESKQLLFTWVVLKPTAPCYRLYHITAPHI